MCSGAVNEPLGSEQAQASGPLPAAPVRARWAPPRAPVERRDPPLPEPAAVAAAPARASWRSLFDGSRWIALRVTTDALMLALGCAVAIALTAGRVTPWPLAVFPVLTLLTLDCGGRYRQRMRDAVLDRAAPGTGAISVSAMAVFGLMLALGSDPAAVGPLVVWTWVVSLLFVTATATALIVTQRSLRRRGGVQRPALIIGADATATSMAARLRRLPEYGLCPIGFLDAVRPRVHPRDAPPVLGDLDDLEAVVAQHGVRDVIVCFPEVSHQAALALLARCDALGLDTRLVPRLSAAVNARAHLEYLGVQPLLNVRAVDRECWRFSLKHALDRAVCAVALALLAPLLLVVAALVRLSSPGPVLFRQLRIGRDGQIFELLKFRTMRLADDTAIRPVYPELVPRGLGPGGIEGADRRTRVGRVLRCTSLDELPQLVNVLRGEMSIVGPRPERPEYAELFAREVDRYGERQRVRAGITGWAQVHGLRGQTPLSERVELDNFYIEHWSLALDVKIMLLTLPALLRGS